MKTLLILFVLCLIYFCCFSVAADTQTYYIQNTTKNLLDLNQRIIDIGADIIFSPEEKEELKRFINDGTSAEILDSQEKLLESGKVVGPIGTGEQSQFIYSSYVDAQNFVAMDETFHKMDFIVRQCSKITALIDNFQA